MKITLKHIPKQSTNKSYAGKHWSLRHKEKSEMVQLVRLQTKFVIEKPCNINYTFYWVGRVLDSDNNSIVGKMITDILTNRNDGYKQIHRISYESEKSLEKYNYCEVEILDYQDTKLLD